MKKGNIFALLPIGVFLVFYLGLGLTFEYILKIPMGFYKVPITLAFLFALAIACLQNRKVRFSKKLAIMGRGIGDENIVTMILIFMVAGVFVGVVGREGATSIAYLLLSFIPPEFSVAVLFLASCFISISMGTSVGTITLLSPIALTISNLTGFSLALCLASLIGGAMFGDNLSFISDTTIAACKGQGVKMRDKFKENFFIALPAAILTLGIILFICKGEAPPQIPSTDIDLVKIIPYIVVLLGGIVGIDVFVILACGIISGGIISVLDGADFAQLIESMGGGLSGMYETIALTLLVGAIAELIKENGGFDFILYGAKRLFKGKKGAKLGIGMLCGMMDIATANNTVAIVMANPIAKEMAKEYGISPRKSASLLDIFSCIFQGLLPYGAQMLVALSAVNELGACLSAFDVLPFMFYPFALLLSTLVFIFFIPERK